MSNADLFVSVVYVLYILAPVLRDELWLRSALFLNSLGFAGWGLLIGSWPVVVANALFCLLSLRQIHRAWSERQPADLEEEALRVATALFPDMSGRDLELLWSCGEESTTAAARLTELGEEVDALFVVMEGAIQVGLADGQVVRLTGPAVVGEVTTLSPHITVATATVDVRQARVRKWAKSDLDRLAQERPTMMAPFLQGLSAEMAERVLRQPVPVG